MAKPRPSVPDSVIATAVVIPTRAPFVSNRPPPDDPAAIDASVWIMPVSACVAAVGVDRAVQRTDDAERHRRAAFEPERRADRDRRLADLQRCRLAEQRDRMAGAADLHHGDVAVGVGADEAAFVLRAVREDRR